MGLSSCVSGSDVASDSDRAVFGQLLLACLDPSNREEAERQLRQAEINNPVCFVRICAEELGDASRPVLARQMAGLLFANALSVGYPLADSWSQEVPEPTRATIHAALLGAIKSEERAIWSSAANATAKIAIIEVPMGHWPDLMSCLHHWAKGDVINHNDCLHEASLMVIKCLAEAWPLERFIPDMASSAAQGMAPAFNQHVRLLAAETLQQILETTPEHSMDTIPRCPDVVIEAVLSGCQVGTALQLQIASFSCLEQLCINFSPYVASDRERIFSVGLAAMRSSPIQARGIVMDLWRTLATQQFLVMTNHDDHRLGLYNRLVPELLQLVLETVCSDSADDEAMSVALPARTLLAAVCAASDHINVDDLASFAAKHVRSPDVRFRRAAFLALGAAAANRIPDVPIELIVEALQSPPICGVACWAVGRMLEFAASGISGNVKLQLFALSLQGICDADYAEDFQYILLQLVQSLVVTPNEYVEISCRLLQVASTCPPIARGIILATLSCLIKRAAPDSRLHFRDTVSSLLTLSREIQLTEFKKCRRADGVVADAIERRVCWDGVECTFEEFKVYYGKTAVKNWHMSPKAEHATVIDGVARCLHDLASGLGEEVMQVAEPLMSYYIGNLQATCSQGAGLDEDTLYAIGSLAIQLGPPFLNVAGPYSELWPLLLHGMGAPAATRYDLAAWDFPLSCEASLVAFCLLLDALGKIFSECWYVENSRAVLQRVLSAWYLPSRLRCLAVTALGRLVFLVGGVLQSVPMVLDSMKKSVATLPASNMVRTRFSPHSLPDVGMGSANQARRVNFISAEHLSCNVCNHGLRMALIQAYFAICGGLKRAESLPILKHEVFSILDFGSQCLKHPTESGMQVEALKLIVLIVDLFPEHAEVLNVFKEQLSQFPDIDPVAGLESRLQRCILTG